MAISRATPMATYWVHLRFSLDFLLRYHALDALFHLSPGGQHLVAASGAPQADVHPHPQHLPPAAAAGVFLFSSTTSWSFRSMGSPAFPVNFS